jgi:hypothetical protein
MLDRQSKLPRWAAMVVCIFAVLGTGCQLVRSHHDGPSQAFAAMMSD